MFDTPEAIVAGLSSRESETVWRYLAESTPDLDLASAAYSLANTEVRTLLLQVLREWRTPECLPLAGRALDSREGAVWKEALDVFVTVGNETAAEHLRQALALSEGAKREWIQEALQQVLHGMESGDDA